MIGRKNSIQRLREKLDSKKSELITVTGRRRVGKTYLIDQVLRDHYCFSMTGIKDGDYNTQLVNFYFKLKEYSPLDHDRPYNWQEAFYELKRYLTSLSKDQKQVIFIDELPWITTPRSNLVQLLAHLWNDYLSKEQHFILVLCGSASSWIQQKIINDKGGLHNRVSEIIQLKPFTLAETKAFLESKSIQLTPIEIVKVYMALGGVPFYLEQIKRGENFTTAIERICFDESGVLFSEYDNLFSALFNNHTIHEKIIAALVQKQRGMTKKEIASTIGMESSTGHFNRAMNELEACNFILNTQFYKKKRRNTHYRVIDEFCIFHNKFLGSKQRPKGQWQQIIQSQAYKIWSGYAYESICHKSIDAIKRKLQIQGVKTDTYSFALTGNDERKGAQIDLLIERKDQVIHLCEVKFYEGPFTITKDYYQNLINKRIAFKEYSKTKYQIFITMITTHGVKENPYAMELVDQSLVIEDLFY